MKSKLLTVLSTFMLAGSVHAGLILNTPILGGALLVKTDGDVQAEFLGSNAGYFNTLYLGWGTDKIFDKSTPLNTVVDLGYFDAGTELIFRLFVTNTGDNFFTGDQSRNVDSLPHAEAITTKLQDGSYLTTVGFEDLWGGGDLDYDDFTFSLTNVVDPLPPEAAVPEPPILALLACGLAGLLFSRRRLRLVPDRTR